MLRRDVQVVSLKMAAAMGLLTIGQTGLGAQDNNCFISGECPGIAACGGTPEWVGNCTIRCLSSGSGSPSVAVCSGA
jgi:hypothetical protein